MLAGFEDGRADEGVGAGPASLLGLRIANEHGWVAPGADPSNGCAHRTADGEGRIEVTDTLTPILTKFWDDPQSWTLATYERHDGYKALTKALDMEPQAIIDAVKDSSIRGRGGAGFPTGMKWSFMSPPDGGPRYLVVNADESEPGTCKDVPLMMANPHSLIEGVAISSYAIGCEHAFIYLRGEVVHVYRRLLRAVEEARAAGHLGDDVGGKGVKVDITVHAGAGAYICGEETALLDSLEGRRGQPRLKPPFPGAAGLYARPTSVNNVESIASVPGIILEGSDWFKGMGTEKSTGFGIFSLSGHVTNPGQFEAPARHHDARAHRPRRRHARRPEAEVLDAWRLARRRSSPTSTSTCRSTSTRWPPRARCSAPAPCRCSTRPSRSCAPSPAGPTSTPTSPAASARRAARARGGCARS